MQLEFRTIDLERDFEICVQARRDAYFCSFHTYEGYADFISGYQERIQERQALPEWVYLHIWAGNKVVGQLEFRNFSDEPDTGYVQLIYLFPEYRGIGIATELQAYIRLRLLSMGCKWAMLSVSRTNLRAINHYHRFGWVFLRPNPKHEETDFYRLRLDTSLL